MEEVQVIGKNWHMGPTQPTTLPSGEIKSPAFDTGSFWDGILRATCSS